MMQLDVYSCAEFDPYTIAEKIKQDFDVVKLDYKFLNRETGLKPIRTKKQNMFSVQAKYSEQDLININKEE